MPLRVCMAPEMKKVRLEKKTETQKEQSSTILFMSGFSFKSQNAGSLLIELSEYVCPKR